MFVQKKLSLTACPQDGSTLWATPSTSAALPLSLTTDYKFAYIQCCLLTSLLIGFDWFDPVFTPYDLNPYQSSTNEDLPLVKSS